MWYLKSQRNHSYDAYMAFATNWAGYHIIITTHLKWAWPIFPSPSGWSIGSCFPIHSVSGRRATQMRTAADRTTSAICLHVCALTVGMVEGAMKAESVVNDTPSVSNLRVTTSASVPRTSSGHSQGVPLFIIHKSVEIFHFCVYSMYNKHYQYQPFCFFWKEEACCCDWPRPFRCGTIWHYRQWTLVLCIASLQEHGSYKWSRYLKWSNNIFMISWLIIDLFGISKK